MKKQNTTDILASLLSQSAQRGAKNSFDYLCAKGCDARRLAEMFVWLRKLHKSTPVVVEDGGRRRKIALRMLDSWETALGDVDLRELKQIARRAKKLEQDVRGLASTYLVQHLIAEGKIKREDLLASGLNLEHRFTGLVELPRLAREFGPKQKPDYNGHLVEICTYVESCTQKPNYPKIVDVITAIVPQDADNPITPDSLRKLMQRRRAKK